MERSLQLNFEDSLCESVFASLSFICEAYVLAWDYFYFDCAAYLLQEPRSPSSMVLGPWKDF